MYQEILSVLSTVETILHQFLMPKADASTVFFCSRTSTKVSIHQQKFIPLIIRRVRRLPFASFTVSRLRTGSPFVARSLDRLVGLKVASHVWRCMPNKCCFTVFYRFWLQCSRGLKRKNTTSKEKREQISK
jgi:hypothetical protein